MIGNDAAIALGGSQGQFELNVRVPLHRPQPARLDQAARRHLSAARTRVRQRDRAERGDALSATPSRRCRSRPRSTPHIGYDVATEIVKEAASSNRTVREVASERGVDDAVLDEALDFVRDGAPPRLSPVDGGTVESRPRRADRRPRPSRRLRSSSKPDALGLGHAHDAEARAAPAHRLVQAPRRVQRPARGRSARGGDRGCLRRQLRPRRRDRGRGPRHPRGDLRPRGSPARRSSGCGAPPPRFTSPGALYDDSLAASREHAAATGALEVHAFDDPAIVAGQGTCGRELDAQAPGLDTILVGVGGGGLCAGVAAWFGERARVIAVEPEAGADLLGGARGGAPVEVEVGGVASDSLGARRLGEVPWAVMSRCEVGSVLVADEAIRDAQRRLWARGPGRGRARRGRGARGADLRRLRPRGAASGSA